MQNTTINILTEEQLATLTKKDLVFLKISIGLFSAVLTISCIHLLF